jgi:hypothetical protein
LHRTVREQRVGLDQQRVGSFSHRDVERWPDIATGCGGQNFELLSHSRSRRLHVRDRGPTLRIVRIDQDRKPRVSMQELMQKPELLCHKPRIQGGDPGDVTARSVEADDEASLDWIDSDHEHNRNCRGRCFCSESGGYAARCRDDAHRPAYEISRQLRQPTVFAVRPAVLDRHVAALDVPSFTEPFAESGREFCVCFG